MWHPKTSFSLRASCDSDGFRNGFRWVPHVGLNVEFELSPKASAETGMGSVWVPNGFRTVPFIKIELSLKVSAETGMGSVWVPNGFRTVPGRESVVQIELAPKASAEIRTGSVWVPNGFRALPGRE